MFRSDDEELIGDIDAAHRRVSADQRHLFRLIAEADRRQLWQGSGARDMAHWLRMRHGISDWKARRWIAGARALEGLPRVAEAFAAGELGIDKVVELTRFATPQNEAGLIAWARNVSCGCIRRRAELEARRSIEDEAENERDRSLSWWYYDEGRRFGLEADLPASDGAVVAKALTRLADRLPVMPGEDRAAHVEERRADALVTLCSAKIAADPDPDRATVIVHAPVSAMIGEDANAEIEDGPVISARTVRRLACNARIQTVLEDDAGQPVRLGRISREPSEALLRQLRYRDRECRFPGCGSRRFTHAHHIVWWRNGGRTDLDNLVLVCSFHHRLVHEHGWRVERDAFGDLSWFRADGGRYRTGPAPPATTPAPDSPADAIPPWLNTPRSARVHALAPA